MCTHMCTQQLQNFLTKEYKGYFFHYILNDLFWILAYCLILFHEESSWKLIAYSNVLLLFKLPFCAEIFIIDHYATLYCFIHEDLNDI